MCAERRTLADEHGNGTQRVLAHRQNSSAYRRAKRLLWQTSLNDRKWCASEGGENGVGGIWTSASGWAAWRGNAVGVTSSCCRRLIAGGARRHLSIGGNLATPAYLRHVWRQRLPSPNCLLARRASSLCLPRSSTLLPALCSALPLACAPHAGMLAAWRVGRIGDGTVASEWLATVRFCWFFDVVRSQNGKMAASRR